MCPLVLGDEQQDHTDARNGAAAKLRLVAANHGVMDGGKVQDIATLRFAQTGETSLPELSTRFYEADIPMDFILGYPAMKRHRLWISAGDDCLAKEGKDGNSLKLRSLDPYIPHASVRFSGRLRTPPKI